MDNSYHLTFKTKENIRLCIEVVKDQFHFPDHYCQREKFDHFNDHFDVLNDVSYVALRQRATLGRRRK